MIELGVVADHHLVQVPGIIIMIIIIIIILIIWCRYSIRNGWPGSKISTLLFT